MTRTVTTKAVKRIITKGLTGWEAGKLILQDFIDSYHGRDSVLTEADMAAIQNTPMKGGDIRDYNTFMALCRGFNKGCMLGEWTCTACAAERERQRKKRAYHERKNQQQSIDYGNILRCRQCERQREPGHTYCPECAKHRKTITRRHAQSRYWRKQHIC